MKNHKQQWIEKGYEHFALYGPDNISVNKLSLELNLSRASFYYHFSDMEIFIDILLDFHWDLHVNNIDSAALECKKLIPDFYLFLEQFPIPIKFSRQLFLNRNITKYNFLFMKTYNATAKEFLVKLFCEKYGLIKNQDSYDLWLTVGDAWYSRLGPSDLSAKKMQQLAEEVLDSVMKFISTDLYLKMQKSKTEK